MSVKVLCRLELKNRVSRSRSFTDQTVSKAEARSVLTAEKRGNFAAGHRVTLAELGFTNRFNRLQLENLCLDTPASAQAVSSH